MGTMGNGKDRIEVEERTLAVKLTEAELLERGDKMADAELGIEALKLKRSVVNTKIKEQVDTRARLAHAIESGFEDRQVRCCWVEDYTHNVFRLVRQDTGEHIDDRPMTAADRQGRLGLDAVEHTHSNEQDYDPDTGEVAGDGAVPTQGKPKLRTRQKTPSPAELLPVEEVDVGEQRIDFAPKTKPKGKRPSVKPFMTKALNKRKRNNGASKSQHVNA